MKIDFNIALNAKAMLAYWDKDLICRFASKAYADWLGLDLAVVVNKMHVSQILGSSYERAANYFRTAQKHDVYITLCSTTSPCGRYAQAEIDFSPDEVNGAVIGFYARVTERTKIDDFLDEDNYLSKSLNIPPLNEHQLSEIVDTLKSCLLSEFPGISSIAKKHFISESKLKRDFKKQYNHSLFSFYRNLQMELADQYLKEKKYNKNQLALMFNFANPSNFSVCYQKYLKEKENEQLIADMNKKNEEQYKTFIEQAPLAIAMLDKHLSIMAVSQKWITDYELEETAVINKHIFEVLPETKTLFCEIYNRCLLGHSDKNEEALTEKKDGSPGWIRWDIRPWYLNTDEIGGIMIYTEDITKFKLKEEQNRHIAEILRKTSELSRIGTWTRNCRTNHIEWSDVLKDILEVPADFTPSTNGIMDFYREGASRELMEQSLQDAFEKGASFDIEVELISAKGNLKLVRIVGYPEFYNGKCENISGIFQDISYNNTINWPSAGINWAFKGR
ncbi:PAS domain S-box-containing protein [Mucilaginibacter yixingensis]|uniref:histidine kinase n=1 Tax=Mucilaginibacter yixingensis TaxID=1295612 RepID=A0A2T5J9C3_9SPHI|nr:PAS domain-containing protein [Mucilaginibacter yixingensis]PTQ96665.1 PAS domain S-box-containing protein [Mucilaginibacter yixingensis]